MAEDESQERWKADVSAGVRCSIHATRSAAQPRDQYGGMVWGRRGLEAREPETIKDDADGGRIGGEPSILSR